MPSLSIRASIGALVLLAGCNSGAEVPPADTAAGPDAAPVAAGSSEIIEVGDAEALVTSVADLKKEAVVLNFWATWCGPCKAEFPTFVQFDKDAADDVEVRFVSVDDAADLPAVRTFLDKHGVTEPSYLYTGATDVTSQINPLVGGAIPITMILDGDGILKDTHVGIMDAEALAAKVDAVRRGETPPRS